MDISKSSSSTEILEFLEIQYLKNLKSQYFVDLNFYLSYQDTLEKFMIVKIQYFADLNSIIDQVIDIFRYITVPRGCTLNCI